jgi:hypothetical protein
MRRVLGRLSQPHTQYSTNSRVKATHADPEKTKWVLQKKNEENGKTRFQ